MAGLARCGLSVQTKFGMSNTDGFKVSELRIAYDHDTVHDDRVSTLMYELRDLPGDTRILVEFDADKARLCWLVFDEETE